jgi:methylase of polypeptide subunit release factors
MNNLNQQTANALQVDNDDAPLPAALVELAKHLHESDYRFITPTPVTHERVNQRAALTGAATLRDVFGWNRPFARGFLSDEQEHELLASGIIETQGDHLISRVRWSSLDRFLLVHSAFPTTQEDSVFFGPDTYRFAQSIQHYLSVRQAPVYRAVDIGCGTGAGAMLIAAAHPHAEVFAVDINPKALSFAKVNAAVAELDNMVCCASNVLNDLEGSFDLIVANPPYMKDSKQRAYRHGGDALGADLSTLIVRESLDRLSLGGSLVLYTGVAIVDGEDPFLESVRHQLDSLSLDWHYQELDPDVFGEELLEPGYEQVERIAAVELVVTRRRL